MPAILILIQQKPTEDRLVEQLSPARVREPIELLGLAKEVKGGQEDRASSVEIDSRSCQFCSYLGLLRTNVADAGSKLVYWPIGVSQ